jgi:hypothetical protein
MRARVQELGLRYGEISEQKYVDLSEGYRAELTQWGANTTREFEHRDKDTRKGMRSN